MDLHFHLPLTPGFFQALSRRAGNESSGASFFSENLFFGSLVRRDYF
jgi:hypothetical protein